MKYLLDTHILIWWAEDNKKLKPEHKDFIADPENMIFVSVVSVWKTIIKTKLKKIRLKTSIDKIIESKQQQIVQAEQWKRGLMQGLFV